MADDLFWVLQEDAVSDDEFLPAADASQNDSSTVRSQLRACQAAKARILRQLLCQQVQQFYELHSLLEQHVDRNCMPIERCCQFEEIANDVFFQHKVQDISDVVSYTTALIRGETVRKPHQKCNGSSLSLTDPQKAQYGRMLEAIYAKEMQKLHLKSIRQLDSVMSFYAQELVDIQSAPPDMHTSSSVKRKPLAGHRSTLDQNDANATPVDTRKGNMASPTMAHSSIKPSPNSSPKVSKDIPRDPRLRRQQMAHDAETPQKPSHHKGNA